MVPILTPAQLEELEANERHEYLRIELWDMIDPGVRAFIVYRAGLPRERARDPLTSFTMQERFKLAAHATSVETTLSTARFALLDPQPGCTVLKH
ncbi:hypothetical protein [Pseudoduganella armeniaca]|uniref:Uncharacterized protein n=1 Tax=Pseudoduganella armeniaca TaxID=2072590 RepID=A0A2R4CBB8_9BURK|nr:hypothetical protein [Pseudoduganella armeniaca]AVR96903.1 hypothetical protein C9I28_15435 [Pseudoduganella armeniaca]